MSDPDAATLEAAAPADAASRAPGEAASLHPGPVARRAARRFNEAELIDLFMSRGFTRIEPQVLQPLEPFLDLSGEDLRRRMFVTSDAEGRELCLRPEYTIPVSRHHLAGPDAGKSAAYAYLGPVFRFRPDETGEFIQAGVEDFGREDREATDAEILDVAIEALVEMGASDISTLVGDVGLFTALLAAMGLSGSVARRLRRSFAAGKADAAMLAGLSTGAPSENRHAGLLAALQGQDPAAARLFVEDILQIAGISTISGRSANQIAARFLEQASNGQTGLSAEQAQIFQRFLAIAGHPDDAADAVRELAADAKLDLGRAVDTLDIRNGFLEARGVDLGALHFQAGFGRNLDYYTGFVFEIKDASRPQAKPLVGGGRYDGLLRRLGAPADVPAVGCSIWIDRVLAGRASAPMNDKPSNDKPTNDKPVNDLP